MHQHGPERERSLRGQRRLRGQDLGDRLIRGFRQPGHGRARLYWSREQPGLVQAAPQAPRGIGYDGSNFWTLGSDKVLYKHEGGANNYGAAQGTWKAVSTYRTR